MDFFQFPICAAWPSRVWLPAPESWKPKVDNIVCNRLNLLPNETQKKRMNKFIAIFLFFVFFGLKRVRYKWVSSSIKLKCWISTETTWFISTALSLFARIKEKKDSLAEITQTCSWIKCHLALSPPYAVRIFSFAVGSLVVERMREPFGAFVCVCVFGVRIRFFLFMAANKMGSNKISTKTYRFVRLQFRFSVMKLCISRRWVIYRTFHSIIRPPDGLPALFYNISFSFPFFFLSFSFARSNGGRVPSAYEKIS